MAGALLTFYPRSQLWRRKRWLPWIVLLTAALILAWWIPATQGSEYWIRNWKIWNLSSFAGPDLPDMGRTLRDLPWYLWPAWPLALLAVWRWRAWIYAPHIWVPLMLLISSACCCSDWPSRPIRNTRCWPCLAPCWPRSRCRPCDAAW